MYVVYTVWVVVHGCLWVLVGVCGVCGCLWEFVGMCVCLRMFAGVCGCLWVFMGAINIVFYPPCAAIITVVILCYKLVYYEFA